MRAIVLVAALVLLAGVAVQAKDWAVIVAGSNSYGNYRHQADACHAYHIVKGNGIPEEQIIIFHYDDIANDPNNPFPGKVFNKPTAAGTPGVDVYAGCGKDYTGAAVTPENFLAVLKGNSSATNGGNGKVLKSGPNDRVFINFADHGATGLIAFPSEYLYAKDLNDALNYMHDNKMYSKLVFYLEACESGSMFDSVLPTNINVYATTAANPDESSWGFYCSPNDMVDGKEIGSCLGDLYSINWMENADSAGVHETLEQQFDIVLAATNLSHVMRYGDHSWTNMPIGDFEGNLDAAHQLVLASIQQNGVATPSTTGAVSSRDIPLHLAYNRYVRAEAGSAARSRALEALNAEIAAREHADRVFSALKTRFWTVIGSPSEVSSDILMSNRPTDLATEQFDSCIKSLVSTLISSCGRYTDYSLTYHRILANACHFSKGSMIDQLAREIKQECSAL